MATIYQLPRKQRPYGPVERMLDDALTTIALTFAREVYGRIVVSDKEIACALRQPVSLAAVLSDIATMFGVEPPAMVEDALE